MPRLAETPEQAGQLIALTKRTRDVILHFIQLLDTLPSARAAEIKEGQRLKQENIYQALGQAASKLETINQAMRMPRLPHLPQDPTAKEDEGSMARFI